MVWRGLQSGRHISKAEKLRGTEYTYWRNRLADLTDEQLLAGLDASDDFTGYMTVSAFKKCCLDGCKVEGAHKDYVSLPHKRASQEVVERFREQRIAALGETKDFAATLYGDKPC